MGNATLGRIFLLAVAIVIAFAVLQWIIKNLLGMIIAVAIVAGILYLILNAAGRRRSL